MKYECDLLSKIPREEGPRLLREPDAAWMLVRNFLAFDAREPRSIYVVELRDEDGARESWIERMEGQILRMSAVSSCCAHLTTDAWPRVGATRPSFAMEQDEVSYKEGIRRCLERIGQGESYELCLTNKVIVDPFPLEPYSVYRYLRKVNPAPYAAWLEFPRFWILSSSPEKFLTVGSDGWATSKPIKGTAPRGRTAEQDEELKRGLKASQKEFSENLMVVDLVRHDLGKVCRIGSVGVPELMKVESYRTVHQLVSRVTGRLRGDKSALDCVREMFPPASMTGAPKFRSVRILQELEKFKRRGAYSGALGYVSLSGECDLSVVIRTAVIWRRGAGSVCAVGCGGAIVADSDAEREFEEALLKANSLLYATVKAFYDCATRGETSAGSQAEDVPGSSSRGPARAEGASRDPAGGSDRGAERIVDGFELFFSPIRKTLYRTISPVFVEACDPEARVPIRWVGSRPERFDGVRYLEELGPRGVDLGLERIRSVLSFFSDPQEAYPIIHVTGTNGKGSVCATLSCILEEATYEVGLFTSPFLLSWRESICVNQTPIQASDWDWTLYRIYEATSELRVELSQFEALTVCAFLHFRDRRVDVAVVEVGMGGRLDATNAATKSLVSVVTSVDYDHEAFLGSTLGEIAREKAGILKFGCPAVVSRQVQGEALEVIREAAKRLNVSLASDELAPSALTWEGAQIDPTLFSLRGREQLANLEVVATVLKAVKSQFSLIDLKSIESGLTKVRWPGRKQHVIWTNGVRILIDGAHNPSGVRTLRHFLDVQHPNQKIQWIIGMISTKSHRRCLEQLLRPGDSVWTVPVIPNVSWLHSVDQRALLSLAREVEEDLSESASFSSLGQVLSKLEDPERDQKGLVPVMTGSLHLISNLLELVHARRIQPFGLPAPRFRLLETVLWSPAPDRPLSRFSDLEDHLKRLKRSAQCFGFKLHLNYLRTCLAHHSAEWKRSHAHALKARILVSQDGDASVEASPLRPTNSPYKIQICKFPVDSNNVFLRHKTTNRSLYQSALASASPQADDVVLWNERNEITETTIANVEVKLPSSDGRVQWVTPHASSGLLRGIEREKRIQRGEVLEKVIKIEDIEDREIYLINSLRGRWKAEWVDSAPAQ
ncbi:uncharacterized protein LOC126316791 [Schistocerca gregaria]|uniref:uncharacterized protein LOC126316791 n=1 Tax=Schistocerca gregaria TaxID=7010 RepID=UPI00211DDD54|nr:uncharacterized protein LOC126316791 [Schistocerca gregaria]